MLAIDDISLTFRSGEIHGLLGENGAGKTTLVSMLYGLVKPDSGDIYIKGELVHFEKPADALAHGIALVQQHLSLVPTLTVAENFALTNTAGFWRPAQGLEASIRILAESHGLQVDPLAKCGNLSLAERQRVELLKCLWQDARLIILDEPTSVLSPHEIDRLFETLTKLAKDDRSVILISHKLHELLGISDRISVLRSGRKVRTLEMDEAEPELLIRLMVGHDMSEASPKKNPAKEGSAVVAELKSASVVDNGRVILDSVSVAVRQGEIVGVAGVAGNGQLQLADVLAGMLPLTSGSYRVNDTEIGETTPQKVIQAGVRVVTEDRHVTGVVLGMSLEDNLVLSIVNQPPFSRGGILRRDEIRKYAEKLTQMFDVRAPSTAVPMKTLSGGNQQKAILARALTGEFIFLVAHNPTRGLDVAAQTSVRGLLNEARESGTGILLISSDLDEIVELCDRVVIFVRGRITGTVVGEDISRDSIGSHMVGIET